MVPESHKAFPMYMLPMVMGRVKHRGSLSFSGTYTSNTAQQFFINETNSSPVCLVVAFIISFRNLIQQGLSSSISLMGILTLYLAKILHSSLKLSCSSSFFSICFVSSLWSNFSMIFSTLMCSSFPDFSCWSSCLLIYFFNSKCMCSFSNASTNGTVPSNSFNNY